MSALAQPRGDQAALELQRPRPEHVDVCGRPRDAVAGDVCCVGRQPDHCGGVLVGGPARGRVVRRTPAHQSLRAVHRRRRPVRLRPRSRRATRRHVGAVAELEHPAEFLVVGAEEVRLPGHVDLGEAVRRRAAAARPAAASRRISNGRSAVARSQNAGSSSGVDSSTSSPAQLQPDLVEVGHRQGRASSGTSASTAAAAPGSRRTPVRGLARRRGGERRLVVRAAAHHQHGREQHAGNPSSRETQCPWGPRPGQNPPPPPPPQEMVEPRGLEPLTPCLQSRPYPPIRQSLRVNQQGAGVRGDVCRHGADIADCEPSELFSWRGSRCGSPTTATQGSSPATATQPEATRSTTHHDRGRHKDRG